MHIVQVNATDRRGGAGQIAWQLHQQSLARNLHATFVAGRKDTAAPTVIELSHDPHRPLIQRHLLQLARHLESPKRSWRGAWRVSRALRWLAEPSRQWDLRRGREDFHAPATAQLLDLLPEAPDLLHLHNLHGGYFDLRALPELNRRTPVVLTLHDAWLLAGHCAHSFTCDKWKTGCGQCPDLGIFPALEADGTAANWRRKRDILRRCRLHVATPCRWLMHKVEQSLLAPAVVEAKVIPNGVDRTIFHPGDQTAARRELNLPLDARILLLTADGIRCSPWKDYATLRAALGQLILPDDGRPTLLLALGDTAPEERVGAVTVRFVPFTTQADEVARHYRAADVYVHAAKADTFPTTILEALASGLPVVGTNVGGIPEQIDDGVTGYLTPAGDAPALAQRVGLLLQQDDLRRTMAQQAARTAAARFDLTRQVDDYLQWYREILAVQHGATNQPRHAAA